MSTDRNEYQIPIIFDVSDWSYESAARTIVDALVQGRIVGRVFDGKAANGAQAMVESWWTLERDSKLADGNDNEHGVVVFEHDLDYLHELLVNTMPLRSLDPDTVQRHERLVRYFDPERPTGRTGTLFDSDIDD